MGAGRHAGSRNHLRPVGRRGDEHARLHVELGRVGRVQVSRQGVDRVRLDQGDDAPAEPAAGHAGPVHAGHRHRLLDQVVQLGRADLVVVPQAVVALDHQPADVTEVAGDQRVGRGRRPGDLANHVTAPAERQRVQVTPGRVEALQWLTREKQWITDTQIQICRVPAPTFLEHERAAWMLNQFRELGCIAHIDQAGNVIAAPEVIPDDRPVIAVTAHLDTVFAPRLKEDIYVDSDGRLKGPGVADNGPGLVALIALARALKTFGMPDDDAASLMLIANVGEEGEGNLGGFRFLCGKSALAQRVAAFLVLDGAATDHIIVRGLGSRRFDLTFTGPGGHSWSDFGIGNPVHALSRAITFFTDTKLEAHPRSSINVGVLDAGGAVNSIAAEARAKVDIRSENNDKIDELVGILHDSVERAQDMENHRSTSGKVIARLKEIGSRPAAQLPEKSPILSFVRAADAHLGIRAQLECSSTDANIPLSSKHSRCLPSAPGGQGGGAHTVHEWFSPEGRDLGLKRILLTARDAIAVRGSIKRE